MSEQGPVSQPLRVGRKVSHTPFPTREKQFPGAGQEQVSQSHVGRA